MYRFVCLLIFLVSICSCSYTTSYKQNTIYEWIPGDGDTEHSNGEGSFLAVGYYKDFYLQERRCLLDFKYTTIPLEAENIELVLTLKEGSVSTITKKNIAIKAGTFCVHSDTKNSIEILFNVTIAFVCYSIDFIKIFVQF